MLFTLAVSVMSFMNHQVVHSKLAFFMAPSDTGNTVVPNSYSLLNRLYFPLNSLWKIEVSIHWSVILKFFFFLQEQLTCPSCKVNRKDAVLVKCFHVFCLECLRTRYDTRQRKCPKCNAGFGANDFHRLYLTWTPVPKTVSTPGPSAILVSMAKVLLVLQLLYAGVNQTKFSWNSYLCDQERGLIKLIILVWWEQSSWSA